LLGVADEVRTSVAKIKEVLGGIILFLKNIIPLLIKNMNKIQILRLN